MVNSIKVLFGIMFIFCFSKVYAQDSTYHVILKTNILTAAMLSVNITGEVTLGKRGALIGGFTKGFGQNSYGKFAWIDYRFYFVKFSKLNGFYLGSGCFADTQDIKKTKSIGGNLGIQVYGLKMNEFLVLDFNAGMYKHLNSKYESFLDFYPKATIAVGLLIK